jgi:hypothetical protein
MAGSWGYFTIDHRKTLAAWATRFTMVYEFANPQKTAATQEERSYFRKTKLPPPGWLVFLGYFSGMVWREKWNHRSGINLPIGADLESYFAAGVSNKPRFQSTVFILGHMALNVVSGPIDVDPVDYARAFGLAIVWPDKYPTFYAPPKFLGDDAITALAAYFGGVPVPEIT